MAVQRSASFALLLNFKIKCLKYILMANSTTKVKSTSKGSNNAKLPVTRSADNSWRKCKHCGKFLSFKQLEEQKEVMHVFIPDTMFTVEQSYFVHRHCW